MLDLPLPKDEILGGQLAKKKSRINFVTFIVMESFLHRCYTKLFDALRVLSLLLQFSADHFVESGNDESGQKSWEYQVPNH